MLKKPLFKEIFSGKAFWQDIFLKSWVTVFLTFLLIYLIAPYLQNRSSARQAFYNKRQALVEKVLVDFEQYRFSQIQLIVLSRVKHLGKKRGWKIDKEYYENKAQYLVKRNNYRDNLYQDLILMKLYFSDDLNSDITQFLKWNRDYNKKNYTELPEDGGDSEIYTYEKSLIEKIKLETQKFKV